MCTGIIIVNLSCDRSLSMKAVKALYVKAPHVCSMLLHILFVQIGD